VSVEVVIYTGRDCHLCDVAKTELETHRERLGLDIQVVDITGDADLEARFRDQIPVVFIAGRKAFKFRVDTDDLERRVRLAQQSGA
jgi:glutaredoxin